MNTLAPLWEPIAIGRETARNRVYLPAHGTHYRGEQYGAFLGERARGGVGLVIVSQVLVHPSTSFPGQPEPWTRDWIPEMRQIVAPSKAEGALVITQLAHMGIGGMSRSDELWEPIWAPSPIPSPVYGIVPKTIDKGDIESVIEGFAATSAHVQEAGGHGVELHAAHGYLLSSFLSPYWNRREDEYGGSVENRTRLVREIGEAIRKRCGGDFIIGAKLNLDEYLGPSGMEPDEALDGLDIFHRTGLFDYFSMGHVDYHSTHHLLPPLTSGIEKPPLAAGARRSREVVKGEVPILIAGSVLGIKDAAEVVGRGDADMVGLVRAHLADPHLVRKARESANEVTRRCVGANQGCWRRAYGQGLPISCTVNPTTGHEREWSDAAIEPTAAPRKVLVVGGGPAGMKFAETAAHRGHDITLWERGDRLGGALNQAGALPDFARWRDVAEDLAASLRQRGVTIRTGTEATAGSVRAFGADLVVIATGAVWQTSGFSPLRTDREEIPRTAATRVTEPAAVIENPSICGDHVVIVDESGDYVSLGIARMLAGLGKQVTIVTPAAQIGARLVHRQDLPWVMPRVIAAGIEIKVSHFVERIEPDKIIIQPRLGGHPQEIACDTVVMSMFRHANDALHNALSADGFTTIRIGDCLSPREVDDAIFEGFRAGLTLA